MIEDGLHRARFDSLFRSETIKTDQDTVSHAAARESSEAGTVPQAFDDDDDFTKTQAA
jgi:hypothetical protein